MRPMSAVERFLERLLERPSARLFGTRIQPVQIRRRIERAMEHGRVASAGRVRVPDRFTIRIRPGDLAALDHADDLAVDLASHALDWARRRSLGLDARPRVALVGDVTLRPGDIDVEARFSGASNGPDPADEGITSTRVFRAPIVRSQRATLEVVEPGGRARTFVTGSGPVSIGRGNDNSLVLADQAASRHHARLQARGGMLILTDLGSTNGTRVNGQPIDDVAIGEGDIIEVGGSVISVIAIDED